MIGAICQAGHDGEQAVGGPSVTTTLSTASRWQFSMGYRWQDSNTHFRGDVEQKQRVELDTQMENKLHLFDVALSYRVSPRWSLNVGAPFIVVDRVNHRAETVTHTGLRSRERRGWRVFRRATSSAERMGSGVPAMLSPSGRA
ncbi:MAG: hypothetical protein HY313_07920 [Acidobacteria bacterium]|nr:hypothetical protein [Acidobacteriota bacterium]